MIAKRVSRRLFLRGASGVAVALPVLDIMLNEHGDAYAAGGTGLCKRFLLTFGGFSLASDNGTYEYKPDALGPDYDLKMSTAPLGDYGDVRDEVTIVSGLRIPNQKVDGGSILAGGAAGVHWHGNPLLTGNRQIGAQTNSTVTGPSTDQLVADAIGGETLFRNLNYRVQAASYNTSGDFTNRDTLAFDTTGQPMTPTVSPRLAYETLFTGFDPSDQAQLELRTRQSVLDLVERRTGGLLDTLGAKDRQRLELHYDQIRELENRLTEADSELGNGACELPMHPGDDPPIADGFSGATCSGGQYVPDAGYSMELERGRLLADLMHMAFACDLTRVGTLMYSMFQSMMNARQLGGENWDCHASHHMASPAAVVPIAAWHVDQFAYLVAKLRDTPEGAGSLLDNCAVVFMIEGGNGAYEAASGFSHSLDEMVYMVAGGAGGLRRGEHIAAPSGTHPMQLLISAMNAVDVDLDTVGEVSGAMSEIFA